MVEQVLEGVGIPHGMPMTVIVEVDKYITPLPEPLAHPLRPPMEIRIAIGAGVQVCMVRAMQPDVHKWRGGAHNTRQVRAAHDAVRHAPLLQEIEYRLVMPAWMSKFEGDPKPRRELLEKIGKAGMIIGQIGRGLHEQHPALMDEELETAVDAV